MLRRSIRVFSIVQLILSALLVLFFTRHASLSNRRGISDAPSQHSMTRQASGPRVPTAPQEKQNTRKTQSAYNIRELQRFRRPYFRYPEEVTDFDQEETPESLPKNALGFVCEDNPKVVEMGVDCKLISRSHLGFGCDKRIEDLARERGRDLNGIPPMFRSARVADACPETCNLCVLCAPGCAKWFVGNSYCEPACNNGPCKYDEGDCWDTDCIVGEWGSWSNCSIPCDPEGSNGVGGMETRTREIVRKKTLNGKSCPSLVEHRSGCNKGVFCPVPCEVSKWGEWSPCSSMCGPGESIRTRSVVQSPQNGADQCPELIQKRSCFISECQQECIVSEWSPWSPCSSVCGKGLKTRTRQNVPVGNNTCPPVIEEDLCFGNECPTLVSDVCRLSEWGDWTPCSSECGGGIQTRERHYVLDSEERAKSLKPYNASCDAKPSIQAQECNTFPCDADCELSEWGAWTNCSAPCGMGKSLRYRSVIRPGYGGGLLCPPHKNNVQVKPCFSAPCSHDCVLSDWTPWSECDVKEKCGKGYITRTRNVITSPVGKGKGCMHLQEFQPCVIPCEKKCLLGSFTPWTPCEDECLLSGATKNKTLKSHRWPTIDYWTKECANVKMETKNCGIHGDICGKMSDEDCLVSRWSDWTLCSVPCGGGKRQRTRMIMRPPKDTGKACPSRFQEEICGAHECPKDCETTEWDQWSSCSTECDYGTQTRTKYLIAPASSDPPGECEQLTQTRRCMGPLGDCNAVRVVECEVSPWSDWSECSTACGHFGTQFRTRHVLKYPMSVSGNQCPELIEFQECNRFACEQECLLSNWSAWSECSMECGISGEGKQVRSRQILRPASPTARPCPEHLTEERPCLDIKPCPIPCILSEWMDWSRCSAECGLGVVSRIRQVVQQPAFGGQRCSPLNESASCFIKPCVTDCRMSNWGAFTDCTVTCGGGTRHRTREVLIKPSSGGKPCGTLVEYEECNTIPCSELKAKAQADCIVGEWSEWSSCPVTCGGGVQTRTRSISDPGAPGSVCSPLVERRGCGLSHCKTEGVCKDRLDALEAFHVTCQILFAQGCETNLKELAESQGMMYPIEFPPEARVKDVCPATCDVCRECAPGCQLRDKGNTVCDEECNNEACEFDLGDCGKDCALPLSLPKGLRITPAATGIDEGERVQVTCTDKLYRFIAVPEFSVAYISCSQASQLTTSTFNEALLSMKNPQSSEERSSAIPTHILKLEPETLRYAFLHSTFVSEQLSPKNLSVTVDQGGSAIGSVFRCAPDPCPFIHIAGFGEEHVLKTSFDTTTEVDENTLYENVDALNGVYERYPANNGLGLYYQHSPPPGGSGKRHYFGIELTEPVDERLSKKRNLQTLPTIPVVSTLSGNVPDIARVDATYHYSGVSPRTLQSSNAPFGFIWRIVPDDLFTPDTRDSVTLPTHNPRERNGTETFKIFKAFVAGLCAHPVLGQFINYTSCAETQWTLDTNKGVFSFSKISAVCIDKKAKNALLKKMKKAKTPFVKPPVSAKPEHDVEKKQDLPHIVQGRPITYNVLVNPDKPEMMFCEDRPEVEKLAGRSCSQLEESVSCDFQLSDAGIEFPVKLPETALLSAVCPTTCGLCTECATGCLLWFLGNGYCDPACNVQECDFDDNDCTTSEVALVPSRISSSTSLQTSPHVQEHLNVQSSSALCTPYPFSELPWIPYGVQKSCETIFKEMQKKNSNGVDSLCRMRIDDLITLYGDQQAPYISLNPYKNSPGDSSHDDMTIHEERSVTGPRPTLKANDILSLLLVGNVCVLECNPICSAGYSELSRNATDSNTDDTERQSAKEHRPYSGISEVVSEAEDDDKDCVDNPIVKEMNFTCGLLKAAAKRQLNKGCETTIEELIAVSNVTMTAAMEHKKLPKMTRLLDACPKSCNCCSCFRFRPPRVPSDGIWKVRSTLQTGEYANCIHNPRIEELTSLSCFEIVDALRGNCSVKLSDLSSQQFPDDVSETLQLKDACGVACGKCPVCEDSFLVEDLSGFTCSQIVEIYKNDCDIFLYNITNLDETIPKEAQLKHVCPKSCGMCDAPHAYAYASYIQDPSVTASTTDGHALETNEASYDESCRDHPNIAPGVTCDVLFQYSNQDCQQTLESMGVDAAQLPADLHPLTLIGDACLETCGLCRDKTRGRKRRCVDHPMVEKMNQTCALLIQVGNRGCNTQLTELGVNKLPQSIPAQLRIKDVCRESCGLCQEASCTDNFQNGEEEGVDCGGPCRQCRSCSPRPLKDIGQAYSLEGFGIHHGANRTLRCEKGYVKEAGREPTTIYCEDGFFSKPTLVCGERKKRVLRSTIQALDSVPFNTTFLAKLFFAFHNVVKKRAFATTQETSPEMMEHKNTIDLRFLTAGDCNELANIGTFVCEDNPMVQQTGYDCSILARLGCDKMLVKLAKEHNINLPPDITEEASIGDACPVTCRTCDVLKKKMNLLKMSNKQTFGVHDYDLPSTDPSSPHYCLRVDFVMDDEISLEESLRTPFQEDHIRETSSELVRALERELGRKPHARKLPLTLESAQEIHLPISQWNQLYKIALPGEIHLSKEAIEARAAVDATRIFIAPGIPKPVFNATSFPYRINVRRLIGQMYRPIVGVGEASLPKHFSSRGGELRFFGERGGVITGWYDSSGSAAVVSPIVSVVAETCQQQAALHRDSHTNETCCSLKHQLQRFLDGECGSIIYDRVLSPKDLENFCFRRTQRHVDPQIPSVLYVSCYEAALRLLDPYRERTDASCYIVPYVEQLMHAWCAKDSLSEYLTSSESRRQLTEFCFPSIKTTLQKRLDLLYISSLSNEEMTTLCKPNSCMRHHLRYIDALTQIQLAWFFSSVSASFPPLSPSHAFEASHLETDSLDGESTDIRQGHAIYASRRHMSRRLEFLLANHTLFEGTRSGRPERLKKGPDHVHARYARNLFAAQSPRTLGSFVADYPELFLNFVCLQVKGSFCQQTLLLLMDEDLIRNPTALQEPCKTNCFITMAGTLGGFLESFGERQGSPYYTALGSLLRSYGRYYCTINSAGEYCGKILLGSFGKFPSFALPEEHESGTTRKENSIVTSLPKKPMSSRNDNDGCSSSFIDDGECDVDCFSEATLWDGEDCRVQNMFSESFWSLQDLVSLTPNRVRDNGEASTNSSCFLYDSSFSCSAYCRTFYNRKMETEGCCFTAALEALGGLLRIEARHPHTRAENRWIPDRSVEMLQQSCQNTVDRTCRGRNRVQSALRLDLIFLNTAFYSIKTQLRVDISSSEETQVVTDFLQHTLAQYLRISDADITRIVFRPYGEHHVWSEVFIQPDGHVDRIKEWLEDPQYLDPLERILQRRFLNIALDIEPATPSETTYPRIQLGFPDAQASFEILTLPPSGAFDVKPSPALKGSLGLSFLSSNLIRNAPCSRSFQEIGQGYRIFPSDAVDVSHGATRSLKYR